MRLVVFCPFCTLQVDDDSVSCSGCGSDLSGVLSLVGMTAETPKVDDVQLGVMSDPILSRDGKFMWTGSEWIPAPPSESKSNVNLAGSGKQIVTLHDSVIGGDVVHNITQNIINIPNDSIREILEDIIKLGISDRDEKVGLTKTQTNLLKENLDKISNDQIDDPKIKMMIGNALKIVFLFDQALQYYSSAHEIFVEQCNIEGEIMAEISMGVVEKQLGNQHLSKNHFAKALNYAKQNNNSELASRAMCEYAKLYLDLCDFNSARELFEKSLESSQGTSDSNTLFEIYLGLGRLFSKNDYADRDTTHARRFLEEAQKIADKIGTYSSLCRVLLHLCDLELAEGNFEESANYFQKSIISNSQVDDDIWILDAKIGLGEVSIKMNEFRKALQILQDAQNSAKLNSYERGFANASYQIGICYNKLDNFDEALNQFRLALDIFEKRKDSPQMEMHLNLEIGLIESKRGLKLNENHYLIRARELQLALKSTINQD